ncbi:hypothetical protein BJV85_003833 [Clostridium acetobutylicum]|uniref:DUF1659 domain-containing protein n=1 Tax=Clostridium acetobutylicum (strain ATCC 824 / DSM 792 / JCM 1419 / IAM 19013 / LMG 5710 / NBRC 13948 / NRRL B-527 / VKM B-1787 / 2291 / W) TaxID=272562 RepID=Q97TE3_CLOAB|nr:MULTISPECIES: DUF1659 domain-containing protein [Clostridium]AAK76914.1 Hypothetical protein, CF-45 family [Clostridium acetobutylicum ATCC 824]ADZ22950.1 Conserved hypothetical protein [Clostridium acetobutylicum EA 2018]AEI34910.1 hypothetical protein SMB_P167 [Clostridium acetobutylicum DSM 1731]AWV82281.1 DUF1659 domain-containing protein [Clostridium acetobutylicum]MBC2396052.1 DUF1659 domain-containing protein [Clostridium acetobutylicum]
MAATSTIYKRQLSLDYPALNAKGKQITKSINFKNVDTNASLDNLYFIGNEISKLLSVTVSNIATVDNSTITA